MEIFLIVLGCLVGLAAVLYCVGFALPGRYEGETALELPHPPLQVWEAIADFRANPLGGSMAREVIEHRPGEPGEGQPSWTEDLGSTRVKVRTAVSEPPGRLVREMEDLVVPMSARWEYALEPVGDGATLLTIRNETTIALGTWHAPLFRVILKLAKGAEKGVQHYGTRLRDHLAQAPAA